MITQSRLKFFFNYDPITGVFTNRVCRGYRSLIGQRAGSVKCNGRYRMISIEGTSYYEHYLAWLYVYGEHVLGLDHWDGNGCNNAIANIRGADQSLNGANASFFGGESGYRGVYPRNGKFYSKIMVDQKEIWLGTYENREEAARAYLVAAEQYFGKFAFHNRPEFLNPTADAVEP